MVGGVLVEDIGRSVPFSGDIGVVDPVFLGLAEHPPGTGDEDGEAIGEWQGEPLYHASLSSAEYRQQLEDHDFDVLDHVVGDYTKGEPTVWLARRGVSD